MFNLPVYGEQLPLRLLLLHFGMNPIIFLLNYYAVKFFTRNFHGKKLWESAPVNQFNYLMLTQLSISAICAAIIFFGAQILSTTSYDYIAYIQKGVLSVVLTSISLGLFWTSLSLMGKNKFLLKEQLSFRKLSNITQKKSLQDLVSPHFLFNSLNTAASILIDDKVKAQLFLNKLSDLYDFILKNNENQLIELTEELEIVEKYSYLIQTRFGNAFQIKVEIPEVYQHVLIPPLSLQNLVENAAKHNAVTRKRNLLLTIKIVNDYIVVENNINPKTTFSKESTNLGLNYIQNQIEQFSQKPVVINKSETHFNVQLPLIYPTTMGS